MKGSQQSFNVYGTCLCVECDSESLSRRVEQILAEYSVLKGDPGDPRATETRLRCRLSSRDSLAIPNDGFDCGVENGVRGIETAGDIYLICEEHVFHLEPDLGRLSGAVPADAMAVREDILMYALLALLRFDGSYALHAAAMSRADFGLLVVGKSGCGKSTLAHNLLLNGWCYVSDDAILLRRGRDGVEALALRRTLRLLAPQPAREATGRHRDKSQKRHIDVLTDYPEQVRDRCKPQLVVFPRITNQAASEFVDIGRKEALQALVSQSVSFMLGRASSARHLEMLVKLLRQSRSVILNAGTDILDRPHRLNEMIESFHALE